MIYAIHKAGACLPFAAPSGWRWQDEPVSELIEGYDNPQYLHVCMPITALSDNPPTCHSVVVSS